MCIRNSGFSAKSKVCAFNKNQCQPESEGLSNPLLLIHPTVSGHFTDDRAKKKQYGQSNTDND